MQLRKQISALVVQLDEGKLIELPKEVIAQIPKAIDKIIAGIEKQGSLDAFKQHPYDKSKREGWNRELVVMHLQNKKFVPVYIYWNSKESAFADPNDYGDVHGEIHINMAHIPGIESHSFGNSATEKHLRNILVHELTHLHDIAVLKDVNWKNKPIGVETEVEVDGQKEVQIVFPKQSYKKYTKQPIEFEAFANAFAQDWKDELIQDTWDYANANMAYREDVLEYWIDKLDELLAFFKKGNYTTFGEMPYANALRTNEDFYYRCTESPVMWKKLQTKMFNFIEHTKMQFTELKGINSLPYKDEVAFLKSNSKLLKFDNNEHLKNKTSALQQKLSAFKTKNATGQTKYWNIKS